MTTVRLRNWKNHVHSQIDVTRTVLVGPNGAGKSAVLEGIVYCLTGQTPTGKSGEVVKRYISGPTASVEIVEGNGDTVQRRRINTADGKVSQLANADGPDFDIQAINIGEFLALSPAKRREALLARFRPQADYDFDKALAADFAGGMKLTPEMLDGLAAEEGGMDDIAARAWQEWRTKWSGRMKSDIQRSPAVALQGVIGDRKKVVAEQKTMRSVVDEGAKGIPPETDGEIKAKKNLLEIKIERGENARRAIDRMRSFESRVERLSETELSINLLEPVLYHDEKADLQRAEEYARVCGRIDELKRSRVLQALLLLRKIPELAVACDACALLEEELAEHSAELGELERACEAFEKDIPPTVDDAREALKIKLLEADQVEKHNKRAEAANEGMRKLEDAIADRDDMAGQVERMNAQELVDKGRAAQEELADYQADIAAMRIFQNAKAKLQELDAQVILWKQVEKTLRGLLSETLHKAVEPLRESVNKSLRLMGTEVREFFLVLSDDKGKPCCRIGYSDSDGDREIETLSGGEAAQLGLCLTIAFSEQARAEGQYTAILVEADALDSNAAAWVCEALKKADADIIVLATCHEFEPDGMLLHKMGATDAAV